MQLRRVVFGVTQTEEICHCASPELLTGVFYVVIINWSFYRFVIILCPVYD